MGTGEWVTRLGLRLEKTQFENWGWEQKYVCPADQNVILKLKKKKLKVFRGIIPSWINRQPN